MRKSVTINTFNRAHAARAKSKATSCGGAGRAEVGQETCGTSGNPAAPAADIGGCLARSFSRSCQHAVAIGKRVGRPLKPC